MVADDLNSKVEIREMIEKLGLMRREAAAAMDGFSEDNSVQETALVSKRGGNSRSTIFSLLSVVWKSEEELVSDLKLVVFPGE